MKLFRAIVGLLLVSIFLAGCWSKKPDTIRKVPVVHDAASCSMPQQNEYRTVPYE